MSAPSSTSAAAAAASSSSPSAGVGDAGSGADAHCSSSAAGSALHILRSGRPVPGCTNTDELLRKHNEATGGALRFRFPPEPNGHLHIGHAKSMRLNFGEARNNGGKCVLRFDDTNPASEEESFMVAIREMVAWLGWEPDMITHASDYFDTMFDLARKLIRDGNAYVDHSSGEEVKRQREQRLNSPWRDRPVEESLRLFEHMRQGRFPESAATLRVKADMQHDNPNMRDFIAYRIKYCRHPHTGDKWCVYPSYDFAHCIVDALEDIDFSLCTLEFETRRETYFWLLDKLGMFRPHVWEFSRLNVTGALLSKRKINKLVREGIVRGFDDPRLMTLSGLRRRGYTPAAINHLCECVGITRSLNVIEIKMLESCLREDLDARCQRRFGIIEPKVTLQITNWADAVAAGVAAGLLATSSQPATGAVSGAPATVSDDGATITLMVQNHPVKPEMGTRPLHLSRELLIDASDFRADLSDKNFFGLGPQRTVGLKYTGLLTCTSFAEEAEGGRYVVQCTIDFDRSKVKPKTNISWLSNKTEHSVPCEMRCYSYLLTDDRAAIADDWMQFINADSESVSQGRVEANMAVAGAFEKHQSVQFERFGYFCIDSDSTEAKMVMNRVIALREDRDKAAAPAAGGGAVAGGGGGGVRGGGGGNKKQGKK